MDEAAARAVFEQALATQEPEFGRFFVARFLELEVGFTADSCVVELPVRDFLFNPQGSLHGGVIATVLDIAMGHLIQHSVGAATTLEMKTQFLKAVRGGRLRAEGRFLRRGRRVFFMEARLHDDSGDLVAAATSTWQLVPPPTPKE